MSLQKEFLEAPVIDHLLVAPRKHAPFFPIPGVSSGAFVRMLEREEAFGDRRLKKLLE